MYGVKYVHIDLQLSPPSSPEVFHLPKFIETESRRVVARSGVVARSEEWESRGVREVNMG